MKPEIENIPSRAFSDEDFVMLAARVRRERSAAMGAAIGMLVGAATRLLAAIAHRIHPRHPSCGRGPELPACISPPADGARRLEPSSPIAFFGGEARSIVCDAGTLWVTQGDGEDYVLESGQSLTLHPRDVVVVTAMHAAAKVRGLPPKVMDCPQFNLRREFAMSDLSERERELVALGAAMGSNCVPCTEYHVPKARESGLTDTQIAEAIRIADKVRQVPARKVLHVAASLLSQGLADATAIPPADRTRLNCGA